MNASSFAKTVQDCLRWPIDLCRNSILRQGLDNPTLQAHFRQKELSSGMQHHDGRCRRLVPGIDTGMALFRPRGETILIMSSNIGTHVCVKTYLRQLD